jgi:hypothetical protein
VAADTTLVQVPIKDVMYLMPDIGPMLEPAIDRSDGRWTLYDVLALILQGQMHLWIAHDNEKVIAAMVTRFVDYPRLRSLGLMFIGGSMRKMWLGHEDEVIEWARANNCTQMEGYARKGWLRILPHWKPDWTFISRTI